MLNRRDYIKLLGRSATVVSAVVGAAGAGGVAAAESWVHPGRPTQPSTHPMAAPLWMSRDGEEFFFDAYSPRGYATASYLLRDVRANVVGRPDPWVLRAMSQIQTWWAAMGHHVRLDVTSGLRTHQTNDRIEGAAQSSRHLPRSNLMFDAVDFRPGRVDIEIAAQWARAAGISGLGLYSNRNFLHIDRGRLRQWGR